MRKICFFLIMTSFALSVLAQQDSAKTQSLSEVIVTGQYKPQSLKNSVYQVRVINQEKIKLTGASNVQQVLNSQLGFRFFSDNTLGTADVELMGMSGRNVKILLDGVPLTDRGDTRESLNQVDINTIDRIEIVEGPMSVSYGSDALAGVINIITKKFSGDQLSVSAKVQEETAGTEYYPFSYQGSHLQNLGLDWGSGKWNASAGGTHNEFDGFGGDPYGRNKIWKPKEQWLGNARLGYGDVNFNIYYRLDGLHETITSRGPINMALYKATDQTYTTDRYLHQVQSAWNINHRLQLNSLLAYTDYKRKTTTTSHDFTKNTDEPTTGEGEQDLSRFNSLDFRTTLQYNASPALSFQPGIDIDREAASGARIDGSPVITDYAFFISSEIKPTSKINIRPGLRFMKNSVYDAPPVIPSINSKFILGKAWNLRLAYAYGFRAPALRELYFDFHDANHDIIGNPDLKAEHSNSFSGSLAYAPVKQGNARFTTTLGAFYNLFNDLINYAQSATNPGQYITVNIDKFRTTGATLENQLIWKNLNATLGFSYVGRYNSFSDDSSYKSENTPEFVWTPEINTNIIYTIKKAGLSFALFYKFTGARPGYEEFFNTGSGKEELHLAKIASFHWADISITKSLGKWLSVSGGVKNLFNVTDLNNTSLDTGGAHSAGGAQPMGYGRSYFIGLAFQWSKK